MEDLKDPKLWVAMVVNIAAAVVAILATRGAMSPEEGDQWVKLVEVLVLPIALLVMAYVTRTFTKEKTRLQIARLQAGLRE